MATLMEIYDEALSMVSSGRDLPTHFSGQMNPEDPTWKVAKRAFEHVNDSLGSSLNWSFLLSKMTLNSEVTGYETPPGSTGEGSEPFDPLYGYRWPLSSIPGYRKVINVYSDFANFSASDTRFFNSLIRTGPENRYFGDRAQASVLPIYKPSSKYIYTNANPIVLVYTQKVVTDDEDKDNVGVNISAVPNDYKTALIWGMASYLALSQGGSLQKKAYFENKFNHYKYLAQNADNRSYSERVVIDLDTPDGFGGF